MPNRFWRTLAIALLLPIGLLFVTSLFADSTEGLFILLRFEVAALVIICTGMILAKFDKIGHKIDNKETNK